MHMLQCRIAGEEKGLALERADAEENNLTVIWIGRGRARGWRPYSRARKLEGPIRLIEPNTRSKNVAVILLTVHNLDGPIRGRAR